MATDFTHIRVEVATKLQLELLATRFENGQSQRRIKLEKDNRGRFSLDKVIRYLIQELERKAERDTKYRAKKRGGNRTHDETTTAKLPDATGEDPAG